MHYASRVLPTEDGVVTIKLGKDMNGYDRIACYTLEYFAARWRRFGEDVGSRALGRASGRPFLPHATSYSTQAREIMLEMGWRPGKGLGANEQGTTEIPTVRGQTDRRGLGSRPKPVERKKEETMVAYESPKGLRYGWLVEKDGRSELQLAALEWNGTPHRTNEFLTDADALAAQKVVRWAGKPIGIGEMHYPTPRDGGWRARPKNNISTR